jgi:cell wall-associated NlpC family hydrolase
MINVGDLIDNYRTWLGVRFLHQGRSRLGCDCLGYIAAGAAEIGSPVFLDNLPINYGRDPQSLLLEKLERLTRKIDLQPGCLVTVQWPNTPFASHGAIYTGTTLLHSYQASGKVIEATYGRQWVARTTGAWAIPLVAYQ